MEPLTGQDALDLAVHQVQGIQAWVEEQRGLALGEVAARSREMRLDLERRMQARRREQQAVLARTEEHLRASAEVLGESPRVRAVVAHRSAWLRDRLVHALESGGVTVAGAFEDGADCMGAVVVEQPDLLLVEDRLATVPGVDVARRARRLSPVTLVGVHAADEPALRAARDAGAAVVFRRPVTPADMAGELLRLLAEGRQPASV